MSQVLAQGFGYRRFSAHSTRVAVDLLLRGTETLAIIWHVLPEDECHARLDHNKAQRHAETSPCNS